MLFRKKGFIQFLNSKEKEIDQILVNMQPKIGTIIQKYQNTTQSSPDKDIYKKYILRIFDFIKKIYQKMEDEEWKRVSEERSSELKELLQKCITRELFEGEEMKIGDLQNRYMILTRLELKNWQLFPELNIEFKSPMIIEDNTSFKTEKIDNNSTSSGSNLVIFVGKNSDGKSAVFNAIRMGFFGSEQYFSNFSNIPSAQREESILELVNKKALEDARNSKQDHLTMEVTVSFKIRKQEKDNWDGYAIKRIWKIKVDPKSDQKNSIYDYDTQYFQLNQLTEGVHRPIEKETFEMILERYLPKPLQNLFIINKNVLTRPIIQPFQQKSNFIQDTALSSSDYFTIEHLSNIISKLRDYIETEERQWVLKNIKTNKERLQELDKLVKQCEREIQTLNNKNVNFKKQSIELNEQLGKIREQTKDFNQEDVDKYVQLEKEISELKKDQQDKTEQLNRAIIQTYFQYKIAMLVEGNDYKKKILDIKNKLPEKPSVNEFTKFQDYIKIIQIILKNDRCICESPLSKEIKVKFEHQLKRDSIETQYQIVEELSGYVPNSQTDFSIQLSNIKTIKEEIFNIKKKLTPLSDQIKKFKPKTFIKEIQEKIKQIEKIEKDLNEIKKKQNQIQDEINELEEKKEDCEKEYEELKEKEQDDSLKDQQNHYKELRMYVELASIILKECQKLYERELQDYIQNLITHYFKDIDWEGNFWKGFQIDENWRIQFINQENQSITLPSDGQSKIIMFSLICSLIELHRFKIPWIVDNILSEISDLNIKGFASQVISNREFPQQIFFFSKTEWSDIKKYLEKNVYQCFTFKKTSASTSMIISINNIEELVNET